MAVSTKMAVFWVVAPCSLVEVYQCFRGPCCLHHQALQPRRQPSSPLLSGRKEVKLSGKFTFPLCHCNISNTSHKDQIYPFQISQKWLIVK
jgi:hypothetical protein